MPRSPASAIPVRQSFALRIIAATAALATLVSAGGYLYYLNERETLREAIWRELETIADLKVGQVTEWREERLNDARFLSHTPAIARDVNALLADRRSESARVAVEEWLHPMKGGDRYESVQLLDTQLEIVLSLPNGAHAPDLPLRASFAEGLATAEPILNDLHLSGGRAEMELLAPVPGSAQPAGRDSHSRPGSIVILRLDPRHHLFPLLQRWPTASTSGETLLLRREQDEIVFLNEPRHRAGSALTFRLPAASPEMAVAGEQVGVREGVDYRGRPVIAAVRPVPGTRWILVAKIDQDEAYAPVLREAREVGAAVGLLLVGLIAGTAYLWRVKTAHLRHHSERRFRLLFESSLDAVLLTAVDGAVLAANPAAAALFGRTEAELCACRREELADMTDPRFALLSDERTRTGRARGQLRFRWRDGSTFEAEVASAVFQDESGRICSSMIIRDVTERHRAEAALRESEERFRSAVETAPEAIFIQTRGRFAYLNAAAIRLFGAATARDLLLTDVLARFAPDFHAQVLRRIQALNEQRVPVELVHEVCLRLDGTRFDAEVSAVPFRFAGENGALVFARDVTMQRDAEAALRRQLALQDQMARIAATVPGMIFTFELHPNGTMRLPFCTPVMHDLWGVRPEEVRDDFSPAFAHIHPEDRAAVRAAIEESAHTLSVWHATFRVRHPQRGERWLEGQSMPRTEPDGIIVWHGFVQDVSERKRAEATLREREARYRELVENANSAIIRWRRDGTITFFNEHARTIFGYREEEVLGRPISLLVPDRESTGADLSQLVHEIVTDPAHHATYVNENVRRDGTRVWMAWTNRALLDAEGQLVEILAIGSDITRLKGAEAALRESEARYRSLFENNYAAMLLVDPADGRIVDGNPAACRFYGWSREQLRQMRTFDLNTMPAKSVLAELEHARFGRRLHFTFQHRRSDGTLRDVEIFSGPVAYAGGALLFSIVHDVTDRKAAETALRASEERLRLFVRHAPAALAMFDREMRYLVASRRWSQDYNLGERELRGLSHYEVFPEIGAEWKDIHRRCLAGEVIRRDEDRFERQDGATQWLRWEVRPWHAGDGTIGGIVVFSEDITDRKTAETTLATQVQELRRWHSATVGRETRVLELKAEVNRLLAATGQPPRYASAESKPAS